MNFNVAALALHAHCRAMTDTNDFQGVGRRIAQLRRLAGLSQHQFAERAGVHRSDVSLWETNRQRPTFEKAAAVCRAFDVELNWLITGNPNYLRYEQAQRLARAEADTASEPKSPARF